MQIKGVLVAVITAVGGFSLSTAMSVATYNFSPYISHRIILSHHLVFKRCNSFGCNFGNNIKTKPCKWKIFSLPVFSFVLRNKSWSRTLFPLSWAFLMLLVAYSRISLRIRAADARIASNFSSSKLLFYSLPSLLNWI